jgi:hypothetical protein
VQEVALLDFRHHVSDLTLIKVSRRNKKRWSETKKESSLLCENMKIITLFMTGQGQDTRRKEESKNTRSRLRAALMNAFH